nr:hypothetical protein CFP56_11983 [Quercus suber]
MVLDTPCPYSDAYVDEDPFGVAVTISTDWLEHRPWQTSSMHSLRPLPLSDRLEMSNHMEECRLHELQGVSHPPIKAASPDCSRLNFGNCRDWHRLPEGRRAARFGRAQAIRGQRLNFRSSSSPGETYVVRRADTNAAFRHIVSSCSCVLSAAMCR